MSGARAAARTKSTLSISKLPLLHVFEQLVFDALHVRPTVDRGVSGDRPVSVGGHRDNLPNFRRHSDDLQRASECVRRAVNRLFLWGDRYAFDTLTHSLSFFLCQKQLLKLDMEGLLKFFQKEVPAKCEIDPDYLIQLAMAIKYDQKKMKKLSKDYSAIKLKEQEELVELRRLRTENRLLRQRIENLETESAELADKLIQGQVCRAQEAEDNYVIKRELSVISQREDDLKLELEKANERIEQLKVEKRQCSAMLGQESQLVIDSLQEELGRFLMIVFDDHFRWSFESFKSDDCRYIHAIFISFSLSSSGG